jgi:hypothetical protein
MGLGRAQSAVRPVKTRHRHPKAHPRLISASGVSARALLENTVPRLSGIAIYYANLRRQRCRDKDDCLQRDSCALMNK